MNFRSLSTGCFSQPGLSENFRRVRRAVRQIVFGCLLGGLLVSGRASAVAAAETPPAPVAAPPAASTVASVEKPALIEGVPLVVWGRTLLHYRLAMEFSGVEQRVQAAEERITQALGRIEADTLSVQPVQFGDDKGFAITAGPVFLLKLMEGDLGPEDSLAAVSENVLGELRALVRDHSAQRSVSHLIPAIIQAAVATLVFVVFWMFAVRLKAWLLRRIAGGVENAGDVFKLFGYDWRPVLLSIASTIMRLLVLAVVLSAAYAWVTFTLGRFPYTRPWGDQLGGYLFAAVSGLASGAMHQIPNIVALIVIYLVTRGVVRLLNGWFSAIESGTYFNAWLDPEAARATRRLADIGVWIIALIVAFPYLPGSHSEAFKGISVFLGLMLSLGGAGFVGQVIGGIAAVYSRAVRSGDYIVVGETRGVVKELGLLTTKVVTASREEVTIPNAMLISSPIRNFSRAEGNRTVVETAVTIGYDAPWRQVQAMLLQAAAQTEGILAEPKPHVLQTALDDFYVRYELSACIAGAQQRGRVLAALHGKIQDVFNENGVQIMSPHFENQPDGAVLVPKDRWHAAPAGTQPDGGSAKSTASESKA
jgi:small-conductance mechanosensitive channel